MIARLVDAGAEPLVVGIGIVVALALLVVVLQELHMVTRLAYQLRLWRHRLFPPALVRSAIRYARAQAAAQEAEEQERVQTYGAEGWPGGRS